MAAGHDKQNVRVGVASKLQAQAFRDHVTDEHDSDVEFCTKALKKLKVGIGESSVTKADVLSKVSTSKKNAGKQKNVATDIDEALSSSLANICLCDDKAASKCGERRWKGLCKSHQLCLHADNRLKNDSMNLVAAARKFNKKPLLKESRLLMAGKKQSTRHVASILRSLRFSFEKRLTKKIEETHPTSSVLGQASAERSSEGPKADGRYKITKDYKTIPEKVFAKAASDILTDFSSLLPRNGRREENPAPYFANFRDGPRSHTGQADSTRVALLPDGPSRFQSFRPSALVRAACSGAAAETPSLDTPVRDRVDMPVEEIGSEEACVDEVESSVNELAAYIEHYFVMPKEMSLMAQMMYT